MARLRSGGEGGGGHVVVSARVPWERVRSADITNDEEGRRSATGRSESVQTREPRLLYLPGNAPFVKKTEEDCARKKKEGKKLERLRREKIRRWGLYFANDPRTSRKGARKSWSYVALRISHALSSYLPLDLPVNACVRETQGAYREPFVNYVSPICNCPFVVHALRHKTTRGLRSSVVIAID